MQVIKYPRCEPLVDGLMQLKKFWNNPLDSNCKPRFSGILKESVRLEKIIAPGLMARKAITQC